jgi:uncharacterized protein
MSPPSSPLAAIFAHGWPWYVSGPLIFATMAMLVLLGRRFGVSSNFDTVCTLSGAGRFVEYFKANGRLRTWNFAFILGAVLGGFITHIFGADMRLVPISEKTVAAIGARGFTHDTGFGPAGLVGMQALGSVKAWLLLGIGGFCVGFGTRWAAGCTSGHGVSGMSDMQIGSLFATLSFFASGLLTVHFVLPYLLG